MTGLAGMYNRIIATAKIFWSALEGLFYEGGLSHAGNIALSLLLAVFPFMLVTASLVGVYGDREVLQEVLELVFDHWPSDTAAPIADEMKVLLENARGQLFSLSTIIALLLASNGVETIREGFNKSYQVSETRSFVFRRAQGALFVVVGAAGLVVAALLLIGTPILWNFVLSRLPQLSAFTIIVELAQYGFAFLLLGLILYAFHYLLPDVHGYFSDVIGGIVVTVAGLLIGSRLFAFYLSTYADYSALYAGLAGVMTTIVYLYYMSILILFGAEFNAALARYRGRSLSQPGKQTAEFSP